MVNQHLLNFRSRIMKDKNTRKNALKTMKGKFKSAQVSE